MDGAGCWSTVVCTPAERAALGLTAQSEWLLRCRLAAGHPGNHATDASSHPRADRRLWLEWNDFDDRAQSLIERNPCRFTNEYGMGCLFFENHGGPHFVAPTNGHAKPRPKRPSSPLSAPFPSAPPEPIHPAGPSSGERHVLPRSERHPGLGSTPMPPPGPMGVPGPPQPPGRHGPSPQPPIHPRPPMNGAPMFGHQAAAVEYSGQRSETVDAQLAGRHVMPEADSGSHRMADQQSHAVTPSRRHRMPGSLPPADPPASPPAVTVSGAARENPTTDAAIGDALNEVARALSKLADAIRSRG